VGGKNLRVTFLLWNYLSVNIYLVYNQWAVSYGQLVSDGDSIIHFASTYLTHAVTRLNGYYRCRALIYQFGDAVYKNAKRSKVWGRYALEVF
jgi:hypothetical protein